MLAEAPKQWERFQKNRLKRIKGLPKWKRELAEIDSRVADAMAKADELRGQYDPELMRIQANLDRKVGVSSSLSCPKCHDTDHGNKMNGKPWCMKDNIPLIPKNKIGKWVGFPQIKRASEPRNPTFVGDE